MTSVDPLSHTLGRIESQLDTITKTLSEDRTAAASYRTDIRRDLAAVKESVTDLKNRVNSSADELAEIQPIVVSHQKWIDQWEGASKLTRIIWVVMTTLGIGGIVALVEVFRRQH